MEATMQELKDVIQNLSPILQRYVKEIIEWYFKEILDNKSSTGESLRQNSL
jgi:predicted DNA-binding protein